MAIELLKLVNGETIMADVIGTRGYNVDVLNPIEIRVEQRSGGKAVMIGVQWLPLVEDENIVSIDTQHIVASMAINEDMREMYYEVLDYLIRPELYRKKQEEYYEQVKSMLEMAVANTEGKYH